MKKRILSLLPLVLLLAAMLCTPAFALTEAEVEAQVAASGKEAVTGNVLIWFLCAVAFLKVSQKIDSFMATLGVNVGRTGGSLMAEAMIAMRAVTMVVGGRGGAGAGRAGAASSGASGASGGSGMAGFFKGGLIGMAGRHITNSAAKTATTQTSAVHTAQSRAQQAADTAAAAAHSAPNPQINNEVHGGNSTIHTEGAPTAAPPQDGVILTGNEPPPIPQADGAAPTADTPPESIPADMTPPQEGVIVMGGESSIHAPQSENIFSGGTEGTIHAENTAVTGGGQHTQAHTDQVKTSHTSASSEKVHASRVQTSTGAWPTLGGMAFSRSLAAGGSFANDVIGTVARGEVAGSITGDLAAQSLTSYMGYTTPSIGSREPPVYSDVEIGRGRITGTETAAGTMEGRAFAMYHMDQYTAPSGEYTKVVSADGTKWYKQYAQDAVERKPHMAPDDTVAYHERIVKKLPDAPKRKDRI